MLPIAVRRVSSSDFCPWPLVCSLLLLALHLPMETGSAEESEAASTTPAAVSHVLPSTDQVDGIPKSKQRQRTRRACYPCSKVGWRPPGVRSVDETDFYSARLNAIVTSELLAAIAQKGLTLNYVPSMMTDLDQHDLVIPQTPLLLRLVALPMTT